MVTWNHSSTQKCPLVFYSPLTKQQTRWAICARCTWFPTLNCRGICFSTSPNGNNYTTDTYKSVLSLLTHHLNHYRGILFLKSDSKSKHSIPHKSCSFPHGQDSARHIIPTGKWQRSQFKHMLIQWWGLIKAGFSKHQADQSWSWEILWQAGEGRNECILLYSYFIEIIWIHCISHQHQYFLQENFFKSFRTISKESQH